MGRWRSAMVGLVGLLAVVHGIQPAGASASRRTASRPRGGVRVARNPSPGGGPRLGARSVGEAGGDAGGVALTFDDGPDPRSTPQILDVLASHHVTATFFMVGRQAAKYPDLVRSVATGGNAIGVHTWDHRRLTTVSASGFAAQVDPEMRLITSVTGASPSCLRPPYGSANQATVNEASARGLQTVQWTIDPRDWARPGTEAIISRVTSRLGPNQIVLLHDGGGDRSETVSALGAILDAMSARHLPVVTICTPR